MHSNYETDAQITAQAAHWAACFSEFDDMSSQHLELLAWLKQSPRHVRAFLLAQATAIDLVSRFSHLREEAATSPSQISAAEVELLRQGIADFAKQDAGLEDSSAPPAEPTASPFLAHAVASGRLSAEQAEEVIAIQDQERQFEGHARRAGHIATERGYMTKSQCDEVEATRHRARNQYHKIHDPTERGGPRLASSLQTCIAIFALVIALTCAPIQTDPLLPIIATGALVMLFGSLILSLLPRRSLQGIHRRGARSIFYVVRNSGVLSGPIAVSSLLVVSLTGSGVAHDQALSLLQIGLIGLVLLSTTAIAVSAVFQAKVKDYFEWREEAFSRIERRVIRFVRSRRDDPHAANQLRQDILNSGALVLRQNPWIQLPRRIVERIRGPAVVSLWYLTPNEDSQCFEVSAMSLKGAPDHVRRVLARFVRGYRPPFLDEGRYHDALRRCTDRRGILDRTRFVEMEMRKSFASLTGIVSGRRQPQEGVDVDEWIALDASHLRLRSLNRLSKVERAWLDYRTVVAYPVMTRRTQSATPSVLLAFSNVPNGFTDSDRASIRRIVQLLSGVLPYDSDAIVPATTVATAPAADLVADPYSGPTAPAEPPNFITNCLKPVGQLLFGHHALLSISRGPRSGLTSQLP
jgi:hypothetical protein